MLPRFLFPYRYKIIGWIITLPTLIFAIFLKFNDDEEIKISGSISEGLLKLFGSASINNLNLGSGDYIDEILTVGLVIGMLLIAFSKTKLEDEYVSQVRLESLQWAIYVNYTLLILATVLIYGADYFDAMIYNMFTPLLIFIIRFHYIIFIKPKFEK